MTRHVFDDAILRQHTAVLGKTGSGKTVTAKLLVEQVVASGARVCILDPLKSDWWGLTSSADGKKPGLPFRILGGPRGHLPLHAAAGKAIGEVVATSKLPLTILDMANFEPGEPQRFFVDFAKALMRSMKGVLYLVIEEAHEFAPKERAGFGAENMAIHYAKKLATAGRSKGIRLIPVTQRVQALHNAVLGSCETVIAHRLTTPADQKPVLDWLAANVGKENAKVIGESLSSLPTGTGWVCSGEAGIFKSQKFPMIRTFDNSATPTDDVADLDVKTAAINTDELRSLIGDAVKEAEANDVPTLKAKIAKLEREAAAKPAATPIIDQSALLAADQHGFERGFNIARDRAAKRQNEAAEFLTYLWRDALPELLKQAESALPKTAAVTIGSAAEFYDTSRSHLLATHKVALPQSTYRKPVTNGSAAPTSSLPKAERRIMTALAQYPGGRSLNQIAILAGYAINGGGFRNAISSLRTKGYIHDSGGNIGATQAGVDALGDYTPLPFGDALLQHWYGQLGKAEKLSLEQIVAAYPSEISLADVATGAGYELNGGGFRNAISRLRTLELVTGKSALRAADSLFG